MWNKKYFFLLCRQNSFVDFVLREEFLRQHSIKNLSYSNYKVVILIEYLFRFLSGGLSDYDVG